jgi:hypothetical protein
MKGGNRKEIYLRHSLHENGSLKNNHDIEEKKRFTCGASDIKYASTQKYSTLDIMCEAIYGYNIIFKSEIITFIFSSVNM